MKLIRCRHILQIGFLMFSITIQVSNSEVYTAITDMEDLLETESVLITNLQGYIHAQTTKLDYLKKKADEYQKEHTEAAADKSLYLSNPINAYLLTKRLTLDWKQLENLMSHHLGNEFLENITNYHNVLKFPSEEDLNGAAVALMRLQDTYKLPTEKLARGELNGVQYSIKMSSCDCFELGRQSYVNGNYDLAVSWLNEAMDRQTKEAVNQTSNFSRADALLYLAFSSYKQGNVSSAVTTINEILELINNQEDGMRNILLFEKEISEIIDSELKGDDGPDEISQNIDSNLKAEVGAEEVDVTEIPIKPASDPYTYNKDTFGMLCRSEIQPTPEQIRPLRCRYLDNNMPYLKIAPFKIEEISMTPYIVVYHEVMYDNEIEDLKKVAKPRLMRAGLENVKTGELELSSNRISKSAWLQYGDNKYIPRILQRVGDMTGLDMTICEQLQVVNYGIGGHYDPHYDFLANRDETDILFNGWRIGNRIATVLFYMSDVEQGGATVFPTLRTTVWPKKGTAAFWFNLLSSGEPDLRTLHAACPVLTGTKWVSNLWIREIGQEFRRKCEFEK